MCEGPKRETAGGRADRTLFGVRAKCYCSEVDKQPAPVVAVDSLGEIRFGSQLTDFSLAKQDLEPRKIGFLFLERGIGGLLMGLIHIWCQHLQMRTEMWCTWCFKGLMPYLR